MLIDYEKVKVYQQDKLILDDVCLHANEGEFIYLIGKVGSGKSSLLKTLYCELDLYPEESEKAEVLGRNLLTLKRREIPALRREMGIIFQDFQLLRDRDIWNNLRFVLRATGWKDSKKIEERIHEVLVMVEMEGKVHSMPHELSGGEQQRISIARALLNNPKVIIADEPTGNLDPETADNIVRLLKDITRQGTAVLMSTHNISMIDRYPGVIYKCEDGKVMEIRNKD